MNPVHWAMALGILAVLLAAVQAVLARVRRARDNTVEINEARMASFIEEDRRRW